MWQFKHLYAYHISVSDFEEEIKQTNTEIVQLTNYRNSLKKDLRKAKQKVDKNN